MVRNYNLSGSVRYIALLFVCGITFTTFELLTWSLHFKDAQEIQRKNKTNDLDVDYRRSLATTLLNIAEDIKEYERKVYPRTLLKMNAVIEMLDPRYAHSNSENLTPSYPEEGVILEEVESADVCGDVFTSPRSQFPFYHRNNPPVCKNGKKNKPISDLITILINNIHDDLQKSVLHLDTILRSIREYNKYIQIVVAVRNKPKELLEFQVKYGDVKFSNKFKRKNPNSGEVWNILVKETTTPYVLIARDLTYFHPFARLERQIYAISALNSVGIAGGAFRNETGHWRAGCYQSEIRNYNLRYVEGYKYSSSGCMFCDHLEGPFVARTAIMKHVQMNENLPSTTVFIDWFLQIRHSNILAVNCPDAMYFTRGNDMFYTKHRRLDWKSVAIDWELNSISLPHNLKFEFSCKELDVPCRYLKWDSYYLLPPCCLIQLAQAWRTLETFARSHDIAYELQFGSILGAVKLRSQLPWDPDADAFYDVKHNETFLKMQGHKDVTLKQFEPTDNDGPKFKIFTPDYYIEMWGRETLTTQYLPPEFRNRPTLVQVLGVWLKGVANPGLYARNAYGFDYLKHAQHPMSGGFNDTHNFYRTGKWKKCPSRRYHACLDRYPVDGSVEFVP